MTTARDLEVVGRRLARPLLPLLAIGTLAAAVNGAPTTYTYIGAVNGDVNTASNWSPTGTPSTANLDVALFDGTVAGVLTLANGGTTTTANAGAGVTLAVTSPADLTVDSTVALWRLGNSAVTIAAGAGAFSMGNGSGTAVQYIVGNAANTTQSFINNAANAATINTDIVFGAGGGGSHTLAMSGSGDWTLRNVVRNGGDITVTDGLFHITKTGTGTLTLANTANLYSGQTQISGGTVKAITNTALGFGGQYTVNRAVGKTTVSGATAAATLDLGGASTVNEPIVLDGSTHGASLINSNTTTAVTLGSGLAAIVLSNAGTTYGTSSGAGSVTVSLSGGGGTGATAQARKGSSAGTGISVVYLTAAGSGYTAAPTVTITGANGETGAVATAVLSSLTLNGTNNRIGGDGDLVIAAAVGESAAGSGFTKVGTGTATLSGSNTYTGKTRVEAGKLAVAGVIDGRSEVVVTAAGTLQLINAQALSDITTLSLVDAAGGAVVLDSDVTIGGLFIDGVAQPLGTYGATSSPLGYEGNQAYFTGTGTLTVTAMPEPASAAVIGLAAGVLVRRRRAAR